MRRISASHQRRCAKNRTVTDSRLWIGLAESIGDRRADCLLKGVDGLYDDAIAGRYRRSRIVTDPFVAQVWPERLRKSLITARVKPRPETDFAVPGSRKLVRDEFLPSRCLRKRRRCRKSAGVFKTTGSQHQRKTIYSPARPAFAATTYLMFCCEIDLMLISVYQPFGGTDIDDIIGVPAAEGASPLRWRSQIRMDEKSICPVAANGET